MSRSTNRYVPVPMSLPIGIPRAYYYTDETIQDFEDSELEPYAPWDSVPSNGDREQNCNGPPTGTTAQWSSVTKTQASATIDATNRERHHIQMHETNPSSDITELFRRKQEDRYAMPQDVMVPDDNSPRYFYRSPPLPRLAQHRISLDRDRSIMSAPPLPTVPGPLLPHHIGYYQHDEHVVPAHHAYETLVFHSTPQLHRNSLPQKGNIHCTTQLVTESNNQIASILRPNKPPNLKPAVTVRTPRYFRRPGVFKRPSALCLPLSCEPDPAVFQQRAVKSRLPSTMPAMHLLSPRQRHQQMRQIHHMNSSPRDEDTSNTTRSAPPHIYEFLNDIDRNITGKPGKLNQSEIERIQQIIEQRTGIKDNQDENTGDEEVNSNDDSDTKQCDMEFLLNQYQQTVVDRNQMDGKSKSSKGSTKARPKTKSINSGKTNSGQLLKPKIPPSLKQKRTSKSSVKSEGKGQKEKDKIEIERITSSVLDTLLHDLQSSGIINEENKNDLSTVVSNQKIERPTTASSGRQRESPPNSAKENRRNAENDVESTTSNKTPTLQNIHKNYNFNQNPSSANTQESSASSNGHMMEQSQNATFVEYNEKYCNAHQFSKNCEQQGDTLQNNSNNNNNISRNMNCMYNCNKMQEEKEKKPMNYISEPSTTTNTQQWSNKRTMKFPHDDHTAMELHRSKSYIVNLIDRALSRELGTIPEERNSNEYMSLEARTALDIMSSPAVKNMDNDMCLEITQVLADSLSTTPVKETIQSSSTHTTCSTPKPDCSRAEPNKTNEELTYNPSNDEPMYIKQLKKLRWGHLKHIQREMRRLEDLEKFLDSCSSDK